ncbi:MAG: flagellum-specific ATP synthase FliI, partial [Rhizobiales bacterium 12-68-15]
DLAWAPEQRELIRRLRALIAKFEDTRDLRQMGGYHPGADPDLDRAVTMTPRIYEALRQTTDAPPSKDAFAELARAMQG